MKWRACHAAASLPHRNLLFPCYREELDRPENKSLVPLVKRLSKVKAELDGQAEKRGQAPISWADLIVLAGAAAASLDWKAIKLGRATDAAGGEIIASQLATPIPVSLGRGDSPAPNPSPIIPTPTENASPQEVKVGPMEGEVWCVRGGVGHLTAGACNREGASSAAGERIMEHGRHAQHLPAT